jgi:diaminohydroxyphosphoribosylaminopyrimidine deaminase/5-amino-6-(5-phosphoribosylamino)uracil reductase
MTDPVSVPSPEVDREHLEAAVALARRGWGRVHPNPMVGCVVVREGRVVGAGWHEEYGAPHAEVHALESAGAEARGATAYVSLEPCRHEGKTPACTTALVRAGIRRVVYGASDPTPDAGGGAEALREAGIEVVGPLLDTPTARGENPAFFHTAVTSRTFVALKLAVSLDGRITARPGERTDLTGPAARRRVHELRAGFDGILVGSGTTLVDDPRLTVREPVPVRRQPARVVLDSHARLSPEAAIFRDVRTAPVVVFTRTDAPEDALERLEDAGARVHPVRGAAEGPGLDLAAVLRVCHETGLSALLCEGGGDLARSLLAADRVERLHLFVAPRLLGEGGVPAFPGVRPARPEIWELALPPRPHGRDVELVYDRPRAWSHGDRAERLWTVQPSSEESD